MERLSWFDRSVTFAALMDCPNCSETGNKLKPVRKKQREQGTVIQWQEFV